MYRKNNNFYLALILIVVLLLSLLGVYASADFARSIGVGARAAALYQPDTEKFIYTKNSKLRLPMASTTKIMTALVALENTPDLCEAFEIDARAVGVEGSSAYLREGDILTMEELLYALLLQSANDAAAAIAYRLGGDIEGFADMMNARAEVLGLRDTHFANPHGLDAEEHYTTAEELALIAAEAMKNESFANIASTYKKTIELGERRRTYVNHNKLLNIYEGAIGVKTGYTDRCGRCLVGAAERDGLRFISVTLDAPNDWQDHKAMLDYGFASLERITLAKVYEFSYDLPIVNGERDFVRVTNGDELSVIVPKGEHEIEFFPELSRFAAAPIKSGDVLGSVRFTVDGKDTGEVALIAAEDAPLIKELGFFEKIKNFIFG